MEVDWITNRMSLTWTLWDCVRWNTDRKEGRHDQLRQWVQWWSGKWRFVFRLKFMWSVATSAAEKDICVTREHSQRWLSKQVKQVNKLEYTMHIVWTVIFTTRVYPFRGNHQCVICVKYRMIFFLVIIIISLGQILLSYIANTSRTPTRTDGRTHTRAHTPARTRTHTHAPPPPPHTHTPPSPYRCIAILWVCTSQPRRPAPLVTIAGRWPLK